MNINQFFDLLYSMLFEFDFFTKIFKIRGSPTENRGLIELAQSCGTHRHCARAMQLQEPNILLRPGALGPTLPVWYPVTRRGWETRWKKHVEMKALPAKPLFPGNPLAPISPGTPGNPGGPSSPAKPAGPVAPWIFKPIPLVNWKRISYFW